MNQVVAASADHTAPVCVPVVHSNLMTALAESGQAISRLQRATDLLELLVAQGVVFTVEDSRVRFQSPQKLDPGHRADLGILRTEVRFLIERSNSMPSCPKCAGRLIEQFTFDGFANILCPACEWCLGCIPVSPRAIERFGARAVESLSAFAATGSAVS
jgi:hypothetical protein